MVFSSPLYWSCLTPLLSGSLLFFFYPCCMEPQLVRRDLLLFRFCSSSPSRSRHLMSRFSRTTSTVQLLIFCPQVYARVSPTQPFCNSICIPGSLPAHFAWPYAGTQLPQPPHFRAPYSTSPFSTRTARPAFSLSSVSIVAFPRKESLLLPLGNPRFPNSMFTLYCLEYHADTLFVRSFLSHPR